jgi:hypothetical protein
LTAVAAYFASTSRYGKCAAAGMTRIEAMDGQGI